MSKRDDDSQADMEVGMTTAERRRRRRRGGGLRVPSDNVPRRVPPVAPVPEDPSLAMSIAYSFTSESPEPIPRVGREGTLPGFDNQEALPTVIDPLGGPTDASEFEMKTREMSAVDLEALGLTEAGASGAMFAQRMASLGIDPAAIAPELGVSVRFKKRDATDPIDDVDVDLDGSPESLDSFDADGTFDQDDDIVDERQDDTSSDLAVVDATDNVELTTNDLADRTPTSEELAQVRMAVAERSGFAEPAPRPPVVPPPPHIPHVPHAAPPAIPHKAVRAATVALSEEDLEEVREAARQAGHPPSRAGSLSIPPPTPLIPPAKPEPRLRAVDLSAPDIDITSLDEKAAEYEVDVEGIVDAKSGPIPAAYTSGVASGPNVIIEPRSKLSSSAAPASHFASPPGAPAGAPGVPSIASASLPSMPPGAQSSSPATALPGGIPSIVSPATSGLSTGAPVNRESQPSAPVHPPVAPAPHASPPPMPAVHKTPPSPPPAKKDKPAPAAKPEPKQPRIKPWFVDLFDEDYLRTLPFLTPQATQAEADFVIDAMGLTQGAQVLDIGCGYGRHAMELAARGFHVVGLDLSTPLLVRGGEEAHRRGLTINFVRGDMRELDFEAQFDGAYCLFSTFGYFDDETNKKTVANIARALKPGGRALIEILNRDYVIADLPTRVWWEGDGCVVLEEVELNYFSSRIQVNRSVVFDDGRQVEQEISVRAYSLHEVGKLLHSAGFRVLEVSGAYHTRGRFFGNQSRHIIVLAERKDTSTG